MSSAPHRSGSILIIVAGLSALLAGMAIVFLARNRSDAEESNAFEQEAQARIMLVAACSYVQEASRIGWDVPGNHSPVHLEAYGWIDVRDGALGPKPFSEAPTDAAATGTIPATPYPVDPEKPSQDAHEQANRRLAAGLPVGVAKRFPMYVMKRPPYAIQNRAAYNPIQQDPAAPDYLASYLRYPDPQPVTGNGWREDPAQPAGTIDAARFSEWEAGDQAPREATLGLAWFRLLREPGGATFLVTCGAGATMGYRTWAEVQADPDPTGRSLFQSAEIFNAISQDEVRLWYRIEWSPAIMAIDNHLAWHHGGAFDHYEQFPLDMSVRTSDPWGQLVHHNLGGTIPLIQRMRYEPANW